MKRVTLANAVSVAAGEWSPAYAISVRALPSAVRHHLESPAVFLVTCNKSWTIELGMTDTAAPAVTDMDLYETSSRAASTGHRSISVPFYPGRETGYVCVRVRNDDGAAAATLSIDIWE